LNPLNAASAAHGFLVSVPVGIGFEARKVTVLILENNDRNLASGSQLISTVFFVAGMETFPSFGWLFSLVICSRWFDGFTFFFWSREQSPYLS